MGFHACPICSMALNKARQFLQRIPSMQCLQTAFILGCFLTLVNAQTYNLKQMGVCAQIILQATSDLTNRTMPIVKTLFECVGFTTSKNVAALDTRTFKEVASKFLGELVQNPSCLFDVAESVKKLLGQHFSRLKIYRCMYLGVAPSCMPKDL
ncbi:uncharacterized protein LOC111079791 isoform X1 [Drosophila obscura]|uniref:uncharacterized protein LOC111079791 isoform X1 n=1 Tax=Drosophila obscura TaxID=7282 RepID=UPI001BB19359|nr:uncharacterized protein LOC111079791 isoform X1 [Drosophila obscura]